MSHKLSKLQTSIQDCSERKMTDEKSIIEKSKKKKYYCKYCNKYIMGSLYKYNAHLYLHNAVKPRYECVHCLKAFFRYDMYVRHLHSHTDYKHYKNMYICDYCDRGYIDKRNLIIHLRIHDDSVASNLIRFECKACGADFCENRILLNHIRRVHYNLTTTKEPLHAKRMVNESWFENINQTNTCIQITKVNNNVISIKKCGKIKLENTESDDKTKAADHSKLRTDIYTSYSKAICDYCNKEMLKKSIRNHIRERHLKLRKFGCEECKRTFKRHYQLVDHVCGKIRRRRNHTKTLNNSKLEVDIK